MKRVHNAPAGVRSLMVFLLVAMTLAGSRRAAANAQSTSATGTRPLTSTATVTVNEGKQIRAVPSGYIGFSIEQANLCYLVNLANSDPALIQLFKNLGPGLLRIGAGTGDVNSFWSTTATASCYHSSDTITPALVDSVFAFAQEIGYRVMWQVPFNNGDPSGDAAEAAYVSGEPDVYSIEIGNEPDRYPNATTEYQTYIDEWKTIYGDYLADGGTAPVTGPSDAYQGLYYYSTPFLDQEASNLIALTDHYYVGGASTNPTCLDLLRVSNLQKVSRSAFKYGRSYGLPVIMNETNSYFHYGEAGVSNAFCSALWAADYTLIGLQSGLKGLDFHGAVDYPPGNVGGRLEYYTPINDDGSPAPEYYGMLFYHEVTAAGGHEVRTSVSGATDLEAYGVVGRDGRLRVALINRNSWAVPVTIQTALSYSDASDMTLAAPSLTSLSGVTLGGASTAADGTWTPQPNPDPVSGQQLTVNVPAYTGMIVTYS